MVDIRIVTDIHIFYKTSTAMGYSRKYPAPFPSPSMDDTELGTYKFQDFQEWQ